MLPAQAGVILTKDALFICDAHAPRAGGGDPVFQLGFKLTIYMLPAQAGVILIHQLKILISYNAPRAGGGDPSSRVT